MVDAGADTGSAVPTKAVVDVVLLEEDVLLLPADTVGESSLLHATRNNRNNVRRRPAGLGPPLAPR